MSEIDHAVFEGYLIRTRWFGGKGRPFRVTRARIIAEMTGIQSGKRVASNVVGEPSGTFVVTVYHVSVDYADDAGGTESYQVPLVGYVDPEERISHAHVGTIEVDGRARHLYDAVHDREAMALWLDGFIAAEATGSANSGGLSFRTARSGVPLDPHLRSSPLTGEQSNSSVRFDEAAIMKVFRKISPGVNPDIEIHDALTHGGSEYVPDLYGWVEANVDGEVFHLAMLQEFLRTATDGFDLAVASVRTLMADLEQGPDDSGGDFAGEATRLGEAVAAVHATLRERFPAERRGRAAAAGLARTMTDRLERALHMASELAPFEAKLRATYAAVAALEGIDVQRVHGDLHLGQALRTARGWRLVDFEGEPGRPFGERTRPDSPWRDVAGMLRSFDYAPGVVEISRSGVSVELTEEERIRAERAREWSDSARGHFVAGYLAVRDSGEHVGGAARARADEDTQERDVLLAAYLADKAVYEVVYEIHNRPAWAEIPLAGLAREGGA